MPTFEWQALFNREWRSLTAGQQRAFRDAVAAFVEDLREGTGFRKGLRVKKMQGREADETLPRSSDPTCDSPRAPRTIVAASISLATSQIVLHALPRATRPCAANPALPASATPCLTFPSASSAAISSTPSALERSFDTGALRMVAGS